MGHKVHPIGFRLGIHQDWQAKWYADRKYKELIVEDLRIRQAIEEKCPDGAIPRVEIERQTAHITVTIYTARPGILIGRGGQRVEELRGFLEKLLGKKIRLNIHEVDRPELSAYLVAKNVAEQLERRIAYRRAMKQTITRTLQAGAQGIKIICSGRLAGADIARTQTLRGGRVPLQTIRADIDYGLAESHTLMGRIGVKVWIYKGDIFPTGAS